MKNRLKFIIGAFCIVCAVLFFGFFAKAEIASGTSGTCSWVIDDDGLLTIYPTDGVSGTLDSYRYGSIPWYGYRSSVFSIYVDEGVVAGEDCEYMFYDLNQCVTADVHNLDVSFVKDLGDFFSLCRRLESVDMSGWHTDCLEHIDKMFYSCSSLLDVDLSDFDMTNVSNISDIFRGCRSLKSVNLSGLSFPRLRHFSYCFCDCENLEFIDFSDCHFLTVGWFDHAFSSCKKLVSVDLSCFDGCYLYDASYMFDDCPSLESLDLSMFHTSSLTNMQYLFYRCSSLMSLNLSGWDTSHVTNMDYCFAYCSQDIVGCVFDLNTQSVKSMNGTFSGCFGTGVLDMRNLDVSSVTNMNYMFSKCSGFTTIDVSTFDTSHVDRVIGMFDGCVGLSYLDISMLDFSSVIKIGSFFPSGYDFKMVVLGDNWDFYRSNTSCILPGRRWRLDDTSIWFNSEDLKDAYDSSLAGVWIRADARAILYENGDLVFQWGEDFDETLGNVVAVYENIEINSGSLEAPWHSNASRIKRVICKDILEPNRIARWFFGCNNLDSVDLHKLRTNRVTDMSLLFRGCRLRSFDSYDFDTSHVTTMEQMFRGCLFEAFPSQPWDTSSVTNMSFMFEQCSLLADFEVQSWNTSSVVDIGGMFYGCDGLVDLDLSDWDVSRVSSFQSHDGSHHRGMFEGCRSLETIDLTGWNTGSVRNMNYMFSGCRSLISLDLSDWNVSNVENMVGLFSDCWHLMNLDVSGWDTSSVRNMGVMFYNCSSLESLNLCSFDTSSSDSMYRFFTGCTRLREVSLGENFNFSGNSISSVSYKALLNTPNASVSNGKWIRNDGEFGPYTPVELQDSYDGSTMAGTWVWDDGTYYIKINSPLFESDKYIVYNDMVFGKNNQTVSLSDNLIKRYGYKLIGWNEDSSLDSVLYATDSVGMATVPANTYDSHKTINLYAVFEKMNLSVSAANGEFEFDLPGGSAVSFDNLPGNTQYQVYEETVSGWQLVDSGNTSGHISMNGSAVSVFKNHYDSSVARFKLIGQKRVVSSAGNVMCPSIGEYTFKLIDVTAGVNNEIQSVTNSDGGLIVFDEIELDSVGTFMYQVVEVLGDDLKMSYDSHVETVSVSVSDLGDGSLETEVVYDSDGILFVNQLNDTGSLKISKQALDKAGDDCWQDDDKFLFDVVFTDKYGLVPSGGYQNCLLSLADSNGFDYDVSTGILHVELASDNRSVVVSGIPYGLHYVVNEIVDNNSLYVLDSLSGESGVISDVVSEARFVNVFELVPVSVSFVAYKSADFDLSDGQFVFELLDSNMNVIQTVTNGVVLQDGVYDGLAPVMFDSIDFESVGSYVYYIREVVGGEALIYDDSLIKVVVDVNDNNGRLYADVDYFLVE